MSDSPAFHAGATRARGGAQRKGGRNHGLKPAAIHSAPFGGGTALPEDARRKDGLLLTEPQSHRVENMMRTMAGITIRLSARRLAPVRDEPVRDG